MAKGIVYFDLDGTLTLESCADVIGRELGVGEDVKRLEEMLYRDMSDQEWVEKMGEIVAEHTNSLEDFQNMIDCVPMIKGLTETVDVLHKASYLCGIITSGIGEYARLMTNCPYKFDFGYGCSTEVAFSDVIGVKGFGRPIVTKKEKGKFVLRKRKEIGVEKKNCIAVGNSKGDEYMFNEVGISIIINSENRYNANIHIPK